MPEREIEREARKQQGFLTVEEAAARLDMSKNTLLKHIKAGELKTVHIGYRLYVSELALEASIRVLERRRVRAAPMPERESERETRKQQGLLTMEEAAARLYMGKSTLLKRIRAGELKTVQIGVRVYVSELALEAYIARSGAPKAESSADA
jgi:excisionase family DNA binding protein